MRETYLNSPRTTPAIPPAKPIHWTGVIIAAIAAGAVISVTDIVRQQQPSGRVKSEVATKSEVTSEIKSTSEVRPIPTPIPVVVPELTLPEQPALQPEVRRATPIEPVVRRGLPVEGQLYLVQMDDRNLLIRFMGAVPNFDALPKQPNLYDYYKVASSGHDWIFMQPAGFSAPAWVDP